MCCPHWPMCKWHNNLFRGRHFPHSWPEPGPLLLRLASKNEENNRREKKDYTTRNFFCRGHFGFDVVCFSVEWQWDGRGPGPLGRKDCRNCRTGIENQWSSPFAGPATGPRPSCHRTTGHDLTQHRRHKKQSTPLSGFRFGSAMNF